MDAVLAVAPTRSAATERPSEHRCPASRGAARETFYNRGTMRNDLEGESVGF